MELELGDIQNGALHPRPMLRAHAAGPVEEERLAAKMVRRWPSGAPLTLAPGADDRELGGDPRRNNAFLYAADDPRGLRCPRGAHVRRMNPRDSPVVGVTRLHRVFRRGTACGPMLPEGVLTDDGVGQFTIPREPIRRRLEGLPGFVPPGVVSTSSRQDCEHCAG